MKQSTTTRALQLCFLLAAASEVESHARFECPPPLSGRTGEKVGPCDVGTDDGSTPAFPLIPNAFNTVTWLESIPHPGAPVRFALSAEGGGSQDGSLDGAAEGFESCILLDHIPHDAWSKPSFRDELSWHRSSITLFIPDVKCERCYLQLVSIMSDAVHGVPSDTKCAYAGALATSDDPPDFPACPVVYHSCAPVSINGSILRDEVDVCDTKEFEEKLGWPLTPEDNPELYEYSIYLNRGDVGLYTTNDFRLALIGSPLTDTICTSPQYCEPKDTFQEILKVPEGAPYASLEGACGAIVETEVEAYRPGGTLPAISDTESAPDAADEEPVADTTAVEEKEEETAESAVSGSVRLLTTSNAYATTAALAILVSSLL